MNKERFNATEEEVNKYLWPIEINLQLTNSELLFSESVEPELKNYVVYSIENTLKEAYSESDRAYYMDEAEHPTFHGDNDAYEEALDEYHDASTSVRSEIESISDALYGFDSTLDYEINEVGEDELSLKTWLEEKEDLLTMTLAYYINELNAGPEYQSFFDRVLADAKGFVDVSKRHALDDEFDRLWRLFDDQKTYIGRYARELSDRPTDPGNTTAYRLLGCEGVAEAMANVLDEMRELGRLYERRMRMYAYVIARETGFDLVG